jgi:hypothetical protein
LRVDLGKVEADYAPTPVFFALMLRITLVRVVVHLRLLVNIAGIRAVWLADFKELAGIRAACGLVVRLGARRERDNGGRKNKRCKRAQRRLLDHELLQIEVTDAPLHT